MPTQSCAQPRVLADRGAHALIYPGGTGLHYDRDTPAGRPLGAALEREIPPRARVYDEANQCWLVVAPHDAAARELFRKHFPGAPVEHAVWIPPRMRGAIRRAEILEQPAALFTLAGTVLVTIPPDDEDLNGYVARAVPEAARHLHRDRGVWEIRPPHAWGVIERLLEAHPQAPIGGSYPCASCGHLVNATTLAHQAGRRAAA